MRRHLNADYRGLGKIQEKPVHARRFFQKKTEFLQRSWLLLPKLKNQLFSSGNSIKQNELTYKSLVLVFSSLSLLDILITTVGIRLGCVELNSFVLMAGLDLWAVCRVALIGYLLFVFLSGYRFCKAHSSIRGLAGLKLGLLVLNLYIGVVVSLGLFAIFSTIL